MDELIMNNYLLILKSTMEVYVHGTLESSNESVRSLLKNCLDETAKMQANTYDTIVEYGWYDVNNIEENIIKKKLKTIECNN